jgi:arylsulfatase
LSVDGKELVRKTIPHTIPSVIPPDETFDVGIDTRTSVDEKDYQVPFRFTGKLNKLSIKLEPSQLTAVDQEKAAEMVAKAHDDR